MKRIKYSEITPEKIYKRRREFVKTIGLSTGSLVISQNLMGVAVAATDNAKEKITEHRYVTTYNNYCLSSNKNKVFKIKK